MSPIHGGKGTTQHWNMSARLRKTPWLISLHSQDSEKRIQRVPPLSWFVSELMILKGKKSRDKTCTKKTRTRKDPNKLSHERTSFRVYMRIRERGIFRPSLKGLWNCDSHRKFSAFEILGSLGTLHVPSECRVEFFRELKAIIFPLAVNDPISGREQQCLWWRGTPYTSFNKSGKSMPIFISQGRIRKKARMGKAAEKMP